MASFERSAKRSETGAGRKSFSLETTTSPSLLGRSTVTYFTPFKNGASFSWNQQVSAIFAATASRSASARIQRQPTAGGDRQAATRAPHRTRSTILRKLEM